MRGFLDHYISYVAAYEMPYNDGFPFQGWGDASMVFPEIEYSSFLADLEKFFSDRVVIEEDIYNLEILFDLAYIMFEFFVYMADNSFGNIELCQYYQAVCEKWMYTIEDKLYGYSGAGVWLN